jgi:hypothetical protein
VKKKDLSLCFLAFGYSIFGEISTFAFLGHQSPKSKDPAALSVQFKIADTKRFAPLILSNQRGDKSG